MTKRTISIFLTVTKIVDFILFFVLAALGVLFILCGLYGISHGNLDGPTQREIDLYKVGTVVFAAGIILSVVAVFLLAAFILVLIAKSRLLFGKEKYGGKKAGVLAIVGGVMGFPLSVPGGIMMLILRNREFEKGKKEQKEPKEE